MEEVAWASGDPQDAVHAWQPPIEFSEEDKRARIVACCFRDPTFFATNFCKTYDPRRPGVEATIPAWPWILQHIEDVLAPGNLAAVKSRQMMLSWASMAALLWGLLFERSSSQLCLSYMEKLVDDGGGESSPDSLLGKIRFMWSRLPAWLQRGEVSFTHLKIRCPSNDSYIQGASSTARVGRGSTLTRGLWDEAAYMPQSEMALGSLMPATAGNLKKQSTPKGRDNSFARIFDENPIGWLLRRHHWTSHPDRYQGEIDAESGKPTSEWYRSFTAGMTTDEVARELECDFSHSLAGLVYPEFSYEKHVTEQATYDDKLPLHMGMDFGIGAATAAVFLQIKGRELHILDDYEMANHAVAQNAEGIWYVSSRIGLSQRADLYCHGDPAGNAREIATGSSVIREYRAAGFTRFDTPHVKLRDGIRLVRRKFFHGDIYVHPRCKNLIRRIADYRYPTEDTGDVKCEEPVKNRATHILDALRYAVTALFTTDELISNGIYSDPGTARPLAKDRPELLGTSNLGQRPIVSPRGTYTESPIVSPRGRQW